MQQNQPGKDDRYKNKQGPTTQGAQSDQTDQQQRTGPGAGNPRGHDLPSSNRPQRDTSRGVEGAGTESPHKGAKPDEDTNIDAAAPGHEIDPDADKH